MQSHDSKTAGLLVLLLALMVAMLPLAGCASSDDSSGNSSNGSSDTGDGDDGDDLPVDVDYFILALNGEASVTYEEVEADNDAGGDPAVFAWYDTENAQVHAAVAYGVSGTVAERIYAVAWSPGDAVGDVTQYEEMKYEIDFDFAANEELTYLSTTGDITVTQTAELGERYEGTFTFSAFDPSSGDVTSAEGSFSVTREEDDAF